MMKKTLNREKNRYQYEDEKALIKTYGPARKRVASIEEKNQLFGTPPEEPPTSEAENPFFEENIEAVTLEGFGKNLDQTHTLYINKALAPLVRNLFAQIKRFNLRFPSRQRYYLSPDQSTRCYSHHYRTHSGESNTLSPHAWGIAIDLNSHENRDGDSWIVPDWVVRIFNSYGFRWGGHDCDKQGKKEPEHFEYVLPAIAPIIPETIPVFPFSGSAVASETAMKSFHRNESHLGGYYPLAMNNDSLHGGIHLYPDNPNQPQSVRNTLPGYVVAARLLPCVIDPDKDVVDITGNHSGFVLIRHQVEFAREGDENPFPGEEFKNCYSLYMHLKPLDPKGMQGGNSYHWQQVPWLCELYKQRKGSQVCVDNEENFGKTVEAGNDNGTGALLKPPPKELETLIESFEQGEVVTFTQPFLTVEAGEVIGFVQTPPVLDNFLENLPEDLRTKFKSGFLHWELFTPSEDTTLSELLELAGVTGTELDGSSSSGNILERNDIKELVDQLTVEGEPIDKLREVLNDPLDEYAPFGGELAALLNDPEGLGKSGDNDLITADQIEGPCYPVRIVLNNPAEAAATGTPYACRIIFQPEKGQELELPIKITLEGERTEIDVQVPINTKRILLQSTELNGEWMEEIDPEDPHFKELIQLRWRDRLLTHDNEWHSEAMTTFVDKKKEQESFDEEVESDEFEPLTWWDQESQTMKFLYEAPAGGTASGETELEPFGEGQPDSLFGSGDGQLPNTGQLTNLHPVTGVWLLHLLQERKKIRLRDNWEPNLTADKAELLYLGWGKQSESGDKIDWPKESAPEKERTIPYGKNSYITAVYLREFNHPVALNTTAPTGDSYPVFEGNCHKGTVALRQPFYGWGEWTLETECEKAIYQEGYLTTKVIGQKPELAPLPMPERLDEDRYRWSIPFNNETPDNLQGLITLRYVVADKNSQAWSRAEDFKMSLCGEFLIDGENQSAKVANNFSFAEYYNERDRQVPFKLAHQLIDAVQAFRQACGLGVNIIETHNRTGLSVLVRVGHQLRESTDANKRNKTKEAIQKGLDFLKEDREAETPLFSSTSRCEGEKPISQFFYLEVNRDFVTEAPELNLGELAIPVEANRFDNKNSSDPKKTGESFTGTTFTEVQYKKAQQRLPVREQTLALANYYSAGCPESMKDKLKLSALAEDGLTLSIKTGFKPQTFNGLFQQLINLKESGSQVEEGILSLTTTNAEPVLLNSSKPEEREKIPEKLAEFGADTKTINRCYESLLAAYPQPEEEETTDDESESEQTEETEETEPKEPFFIIDADLLSLFMAIRNFTGVDIAVDTIAEDGKTLNLIDVQETITALLEKLEFLAWSESKMEITISVPEEVAGVLGKTGSDFNTRVGYKQFAVRRIKASSPVNKKLINLIDQFQSELGDAPLELHQVNSNGCQAVVAPLNQGKKSLELCSEVAESIKEQDSTVTIEILETTGEISLLVPEAEGDKKEKTPEPITIEFDAAGAIRQLLEQESLTAEQVLKIDFGLRLLNGGWVSIPEPITFQKNGDTNPIALFTPADEEEFVDAFSGRVVRQLNSADLAFGKTVVTANYDSDSAELCFTTPLIGEPRYWQQAKPRVTVTIDGQEFLAEYEEAMTNRNRQALEVNIPLVEEEEFQNRNGLNSSVELTIQSPEDAVVSCPEHTETIDTVIPWVFVDQAESDEEAVTIHYKNERWPKQQELLLCLEKKNIDTGNFEPVELRPEVCEIIAEKEGEVTIPDTSYHPSALPDEESGDIYGDPDSGNFTAKLLLTGIPGGGEYQFLLDRPLVEEGAEERQPVYDLPFVPVVGTFTADPFEITFGEQTESAIEQGNIIVKIESTNFDAGTGDCEIQYNYRNWPAGKELRVDIRRIKSKIGGYPRAIDSGNPAQITYEPAGDGTTWEGKTYGKADGQGTLTVRFNQGLLEANCEYKVSLESPEDSEIQPGVIFPPCELQLFTGALTISNIEYPEGDDAKQQGILDLA